MSWLPHHSFALRWNVFVASSHSISDPLSDPRRRKRRMGTLLVVTAGILALGAVWHYRWGVTPATTGSTDSRLRERDGGKQGGANRDGLSSRKGSVAYLPKRNPDSSGFYQLGGFLEDWGPDASLPDVAAIYKDAGTRAIAAVDRNLNSGPVEKEQRIAGVMLQASLFNFNGRPDLAAELLAKVRSHLPREPALAARWLYSVIHLQGIVALRIGENENCVMCRGESSCILPIAPSAIHKNPSGSRAAIGFFLEYLEQFPDDLEVRWLLNVAHMTLGEYPDGVDVRYRLSIDRWNSNVHAIGSFRDVGHLAGINRFNESGGAVLEDFDGDGLLDLMITSINPSVEMTYFHNDGDGRFTDQTAGSGLEGQLGGLNAVQTDFNNDGRPDLFICRGAWFLSAIRPSLLENLGGGKFRDVTAEAGMLTAMNSNAACWGDYDNDGWLDLCVCGERQRNRLYHNERNGRFTEVAVEAGVAQDEQAFCKGACWIDYDNDDFPDLFTNNFQDKSHLYRNNRDGTFTDVSDELGIDTPKEGFPCWAWDYDNDGWLDLFATTYARSVDGVVQGILGEPHGRETLNRLYRNDGGKRFEDRTKEAGLDLVLTTMGSNFADFDGDGFLDMYLGTGAPGLEFLVPNRMFRNVEGKRFADISASSGTGHLQKGHGVACGDWDRNGSVDIFIQMGGAAYGDRYHNILFQNPGHSHHWLTLKLIGEKSNRAAIGARIRIVTAGPKPQTIHRHVTTGSSFGANPLEQTIGLGSAERIAELEIHWPTSGTTQVFRELTVNRMLEINEFASEPRGVETKPIEKSAWRDTVARVDD